MTLMLPPRAIWEPKHPKRGDKMNPSKMTPDELNDFLDTRNKVNEWLKNLGQWCIAGFVLIMLMIIWLVVELAFVVKS